MNSDLAKIKDKLRDIEFSVSGIRYDLCNMEGKVDDKIKVPESISEKNISRELNSDNEPNLLYIKKLFRRCFMANLDYRNEYYQLSGLIYPDKYFNDEYEINEYKELVKDNYTITEELTNPNWYTIENLRKNEIVKTVEFDTGEKFYTSDDNENDRIRYYRNYLKFIENIVKEISDYANAMISIEDIVGFYRKGNDNITRLTITNFLKISSGNDNIIFDHNNVYNDRLLYVLETYYKNTFNDVSDDDMSIVSNNIIEYCSAFIWGLQVSLEKFLYMTDILSNFVNHITKQFINTDRIDEYFNK